ncbi:MAG TPA: anti-sigma-F factor Fin family protein [Clostridia bacterium]|jgi:hypothetical protein|nr:anti-sigma-F factor Fin family protein [Clostridia bacterium]
MRFVYICNQCAGYIGELELNNWDETMLGFDTLTLAEKQEFLDWDFQQQQGTVKAICDACYQAKMAEQVFYAEINNSLLH